MGPVPAAAVAAARHGAWADAAQRLARPGQQRGRLRGFFLKSSVGNRNVVVKVKDTHRQKVSLVLFVSVT